MKRNIEQAQLNEETQSSTKKFGKESSLYQATKICPLEMILESANETSEVNNKIKGQVMQEYQRLLSLESRTIGNTDMNLSNSPIAASRHDELKEQVITSAKQKIVSGLNEMQKCYDQFSFFSQVFINRQQALKQEQQQQQQQQQTEQQQQQQQTVEQEQEQPSSLIVSNSVSSNSLEEGVIFDLCLEQFNQSEITSNDSDDILLARLSYSSTEDEEDDEEDDEDDEDEYSEIYEDEEEQIKKENAQQKLKTLKDDVQCTRNWILSLLDKVNKLESVSS